MFFVTPINKREKIEKGVSFDDSTNSIDSIKLLAFTPGHAYNIR
jgi:hypothetical protein